MSLDRHGLTGAPLTPPRARPREAGGAVQSHMPRSVMIKLRGDAEAQLRHYVERIERLEAEGGQASTRVDEVYARVRDSGFSVRIVHKIVVARRRLRDVERQRGPAREASGLAGIATSAQ